MKTNNEKYRDFNKNLLVYMSPDVMPKVDYAEFNKGETQAETGLAEKNKPKERTVFTQSAKDLKEAMRLEATLSDKDSVEKEVKDTINNHVDSEFDLLEHNYFERLEVVGKNSEEAKEARTVLNNAAADFLDQMNAYTKEVLEEKDFAHLKESLTDKKDPEKARQAKIKILDEELKMPGLGQYVLKVEPAFLDDLLAKNYESVKKFKRDLRQKLNNEKLLESTVQRVFDEGPKINDVKDEPNERSAFSKIVDDSIAESNKPNENLSEEERSNLALTANIGTKNKDKMVDLLTRRFNIVFEKDGKTVNHYVDIMEGNKIYLPGNEFNQHLKNICQSEIRDMTALDEYNKKIDEKAKEQWTRRHELLEGLAGRDYEVEGLEDVQDNRQLRELLASTIAYQDAKTAPEREIEDRLTVLARINVPKEQGEAKTKAEALSKITPETYKKNEWMSKSENLLALVTLVNSLISNKDIAGLTEVTSGIDRNENPIEKRNEAAKLYKETLEAKKENPTILNLIEAATNENTPYLDSGDKTKNALMANYKSQKLEAINAYLKKETKMDIAMDSTGKMTAKIKGKEFVFSISTVGEIKKLTIYDAETIKTGKIEKFDGKLASLQAFLEKSKGSYESSKEKKPYKEALYSLKSNNPKGKSVLGKLVEELDYAKTNYADDYPTWEKAKKESKSKKPGDIQAQLDTKRADFIVKHFTEYKPFLAENKQVQEAMKSTETKTDKKAVTEVASSEEIIFEEEAAA